MEPRCDLKDKRFGRLKVIGLDIKKARETWICKCDCGVIKSIRGDSLESGNTRSCGCLKKEQDSKNLTTHYSHMLSGSRLFNIWLNMKQRCENPKNKAYDRYGGRGIRVCEEWYNNSNAFFEWAHANGYSDNLTIDRIENDGNYEPSNCRWVANKAQCRNRRSNINVEHNDKKVTLIELSEITGIDYKVLHARYDRGDRGQRLTRPPHEERRSLRGEENTNSKITVYIAKNIKSRLGNGESALKIAKELDISKHIIYDIKRGKTWSWV